MSEMRARLVALAEAGQLAGRALPCGSGRVATDAQRPSARFGGSAPAADPTRLAIGRQHVFDVQVSNEGAGLVGDRRRSKS